MQQTATNNSQTSTYEIRVGGHLGDWWDGWFDGELSLICQADGTTIIVGSIPDQAALYGLLLKIRDTGMQLLSLTRVEPPRG